MKPLHPIAVVAIVTLLGLIPFAATARGEQAMLAPRSEVIALMRKAADYQLEQQATKKYDSNWIRAAFYTGVMALHETTQDAKYRDAAIAWGEKSGRNGWTPPRDQRHADALACGQTFLDLYALDKDQRKIAPFRAAVDRMIQSPKPGRVEWWWCDALFMAPPAMVKLARATGDDKYIDFMNQLWWDATDFLYDPEAHLYYRDKNYFPPKTTANGKKIFWSRGNGWVAAGTVRVLEALPKDHPSRDKFLALHRDMAAALVKRQQPDGLWRSSLLDPAEFPLPETSGTAFFTYALAWGVNHGTLDRETYLPHVIRGWNGLASKVTADGKLGYVQRVAGAPGQVNPDDTHEYAVGALLLAGSEVVKLTR